MFIERTNYFAKPGRVEDVRRIRVLASEVRVKLGLAAGTIYVKTDPDGDGPDVTWECPFATLEDNAKDMAARAGSADFEDVRVTMGEASAKFERHLVRREAAQHWAGEVSLRGLPIVPREVTFRSGSLDLAGFLYLPPGEGPFPCMVTNHGSGVFQGTQDICRPTVAATLMSWGIASFLPHRRGYGNSPGTPWRDDVSAEFGTADYDAQLASRLDGESDDVVAALDYVRALPEIMADHVGVMGSSFGGTNTLLAAAKCERFKCAVEFAGAAMNWEKTPDLRALMIGAAKNLSQPIFFIQAENDYSAAPTRELGAALAGTDQVFEAHVYPAFGISKDEGHFFERTGTMIWGADVRRFLERWL
ncbi:MAG: alpha/beta hydrolase family protein [Alphaproteobacteria bacterium]